MLGCVFAVMLDSLIGQNTNCIIKTAEERVLFVLSAILCGTGGSFGDSTDVGLAYALLATVSD